MSNILCFCEMHSQALANACAYIRLFLPLTKIVAKELNVRFVGINDLEHHKADIVIVQRLALNTLSAAERLKSYCDRVGACLVVDLDDDLLSVPTWHPEHRRYDDLKGVVLRLVADCDELWVSTSLLAARFTGIARHVMVMPNRLDDQSGASRLRLPPSRPARSASFTWGPSPMKPISS